MAPKRAAAPTKASPSRPAKAAGQKNDALMAALLGSRQGLTSYIKTHRQALQLTDDEVSLLYLHHHKLHLEQKAANELPVSRLDGEGGRPHTPIKIAVLGVGPRRFESIGELPIANLEVYAASLGSGAGGMRAPAQVWVFDDAMTSKAVRTACFEAVEAFILVGETDVPAQTAAALISTRVAEVRAWQAVHGAGDDDVYALPIVLAGTRDGALPPSTDGTPGRSPGGSELTDEVARSLVASLGLASFIPPAAIHSPDRRSSSGRTPRFSASPHAALLQSPEPQMQPPPEPHIETPRTPPPSGSPSEMAAPAAMAPSAAGLSNHAWDVLGAGSGLGFALQEAVRLAAERRDRLSDEERVGRARAFEVADGALRMILTPPPPRARLDTVRSMLLLTPPPTAPIRVHYRMVRAVEDAAAVCDAFEAAAAAAGELDGLNASVAALVPTPSDPHFPASGKLAFSAADIDSLAGGAILLRAYSPCRYPSRTVCVRLPARSPPPVGRFDWVDRVMRLSCMQLNGEVKAAAPAEAAGSAAPAKASRILYTVDLLGTLPTADTVDGPSRWYDDTVGVPLPVGPHTAFVDALLAETTPPVLTAVALTPGMWQSLPARFEPPRQLPPPTSASLDPITHILTLPEPPPGVEYRFTLDGSPPTLASPCYVAPVRLPLIPPDAIPENCSLQLRAAAFPAPAAPSEELALRLSLHPSSRGHETDIQQAERSMEGVALSEPMGETAPPWESPPLEAPRDAARPAPKRQPSLSDRLQRRRDPPKFMTMGSVTWEM